MKSLFQTADAPFLTRDQAKALTEADVLDRAVVNTATSWCSSSRRTSSTSDSYVARSRACAARYARALAPHRR